MESRLENLSLFLLLQRQEMAFAGLFRIRCTPLHEGADISFIAKRVLLK